MGASKKKTTGKRRFYSTKATVDESMSTENLPSADDQDYDEWPFERLVAFERKVFKDEKVMPPLAAAQLALFRKYRTGNPRGGLNADEHKEFWPIVKILRSDLFGGDKPIKLAVNLNSASFQREVETQIRPCFLEALQIAVQKNYRQTDEVDANGKPILHEWESKAYDYQIIKYPDFPEELLFLAGVDVQPGMPRKPDQPGGETGMLAA